MAPPVAHRFTDERLSRAEIEEAQRMHPKASAPPSELTDADVAAMATPDKFLHAVTRADLVGEFGERIDELLTTESLYAMSAFLAATILLQWTPAGWLADVLLVGVVVASVIILEREASAVIEELMAFCDKAANATSVADLDEAGEHLATALTKVGVDVALGLLLHGTVKAVAPAKPGAPTVVVAREGTTRRVATEGQARTSESVKASEAVTTSESIMTSESVITSESVMTSESVFTSESIRTTESALSEPAVTSEPAFTSEPAAAPPRPAALGTRLTGWSWALYESINPDVRPPLWRFKDLVTARETTVTVTTDVIAPNGQSGSMTRSYNTATGELGMESARLDRIPKAQRMVDTVPEMLPGEGTPLEAYMTMRQMKILEQEAGAAFSVPRKVYMSLITNKRTIFELAKLEKQGKPVDEAILETHSVQYANNSIIQSGGRIVRAEVSPGSKVSASTEADVETLAKYGLEPRDPVRILFSITLFVEPVVPATAP
ncbi:MAG TPA: hypothetical protein VFC00_19495 [Micromonosporaceae bacterium]|nr:hypothetical protein [Micromonosporaceae bacterium]